MTLTEREKFISDVTGFIFAHLENYGDYDITATLNNYLKFTKVELSRKEMDEIRADVTKHMNDMSKKVGEWTNKAIEEELLSKK